MLFPMYAYVNGLVASKLYIFFNGSSWLTLTILSAFSYTALMNFGYNYIIYLDPDFATKLTD